MGRSEGWLLLESTFEDTSLSQQVGGEGISEVDMDVWRGGVNW